MLQIQIESICNNKGHEYKVRCTNTNPSHNHHHGKTRHAVTTHDFIKYLHGSKNILSMIRSDTEQRHIRKEWGLPLHNTQQFNGELANSTVQDLP
jgi:hypothetical protein